MTPIAAAVTTVFAAPAPVLLLDTCSLLDLFRRDVTRQQPRIPPVEIDYAASATSSVLHPDLQAEFTAAGLEYFTSLRAAVGSLRARGQLP